MFSKMLKVIGILLPIGCIIFIYMEVKNPSELKQFRFSNGPFVINAKTSPSRVGLDQLNASGSARITQPSLQTKLASVAQPVYVFDLIHEPHYFIQGLPTHWYGYKASHLFSNISKKPGWFHIRHTFRRFLRTGKLTHMPHDLQSEKNIIEAAGYHYINMDFHRGHIPQHEQVDILVNALKALPQERWIHAHCSAGQGRTTVFLTMYDILMNGKKVPLKDIVERQYRLGGVDLFDTVVWKNGSYTQKALNNRKNFIVKFYQYVNDPKGLGVSSWKEWIAVNNDSNSIYEP